MVSQSAAWMGSNRVLVFIEEQNAFLMIVFVGLEGIVLHVVLGLRGKGFGQINRACSFCLNREP